MNRLGVLVAGGPAPGINSVIHSVFCNASSKGMQVVGIWDGFKNLLETDIDPDNIGSCLKPADVAGIQFIGGNILRQSRDNLLSKDGKPDNNKISFAKVSLGVLGIDYLVTIGGDDTAYSAYLLSRQSDIKIVHVPKTIDNDLPLPGSMPTFGYTTAVEVASREISALANDAYATNRWYIVVIMGRTTGHLALASAVAGGASFVMIPEQYRGQIRHIEDVEDIIAGKIYNTFHSYGVVVVAEGIGYMLDPKDLQNIPGVKVEKDEAGHLKMSEIPLASILKDRLSKRQMLSAMQKIAFVAKDIGYELRSANPCAFDVTYTQTLGYAAVQAFGSQDFQCGALMVTLEDGIVKYIPLADMLDPDTGKIAVRFVDSESALYKMVFGS